MANPLSPRPRLTIPGFTAEASLDRASRSRGYVSTPRIRVGPGVTPQLKGSPFRPRVGGLSTMGDYWACKDACVSAHRTCLDGCEGTWENPKGSLNCIICDDQYRSCMADCTKDIA